MKKIITTLVVLIAVISSAMAMPGGSSMLRLRLSTGGQIMVEIDGRRYDRHGASLTIGDLPPGRHRIKVYEYRSYRDSRGGRADLVYTSTIRIQPNSFAYGTVDVNRSMLRLYTKDMDEYYAHRNDYDRDSYGDDRSYNDGYDNGSNPGGGYNYDNGGGYNNGGYNNNNGNSNNNGYNNDGYGDDRGYGNDRGGYNNRNMLSNRDIEDLRTRVADRITDTDKEKLMKSVLDNRSCTTDQVRTMMSWLSFESTKLDFAKWAFDKAADSRNYWKLESEFSFSSSKDEFNNYIKGR